MYAKICNELVVEYPIVNLRQHLPNVSISENNLPDGYVKVYVAETPIVDNTHKIIPATTPTFDGVKWVQSWVIEPLSDDELSDRFDMQVSTVRNTRNEKLVASDWTQINDCTVDKNAWAVYRQDLRDITNQDGFPFGVVWPDEPM